MEFETSSLMMIFFIIFLIISLWKVYAFLPNEQLKDDDRNKESQDELIKIMLNVIKADGKKLSLSELFNKIKEDDSFDKEHYWRFNQNRLNKLLQIYYLKHPHAKSIADIYKDLN